MKWKITSGDTEKRCIELGPDCVAVEIFNNSTIATIIDYIDIDTFKPSKHRKTLIKVVDVNRSTKVMAKSAWDLTNIDFCCPTNRPVKVSNCNAM